MTMPDNVVNMEDVYRRNSDCLGEMDACLIDLDNGKPVSVKNLRKLPPWRAAMVARIADMTGLGLEHGTAAQVHENARRVGGMGKLGDWWMMPTEPTT